MFEYLMPLLVMPNYDGTLLDRACKAAVELQIEYGKSRGVPWGISESGFNQTDVHHNYQYRAFGVPGLGLKRGLAEDLVIAPYATVLALMVAPREACENLQRLAARRTRRQLTDFTRRSITRLASAAGRSERHRPFLHGASPGDEFARAGFVCCAISRCNAVSCRAHCSRRPNCCCRSGCQKPRRACCPKIWNWRKRGTRFGEGEDVMRVFKSPTSRTPEIHLLSNGRYHVAVSNAGGGYSRWRDLAVTRWREDATRDCWGAFIYLRDVETGEFWSAAHQPTLRATKNYEAIFTQARAEFRAAPSALWKCTRRSVFRRKTTSSCGASL